MATPATVDEYLEALPEARRAALEQLRQAIRAAAPDATETIAYNMPAYRQGGRFLVSFAAYKNHNSLFPASAGVMAAYGDALARYHSGRGTLRFPADEPIPLELVTKIVEKRLEEDAAASR